MMNFVRYSQRSAFVTKELKRTLRAHPMVDTISKMQKSPFSTQNSLSRPPSSPENGSQMSRKENVNGSSDEKSSSSQETERKGIFSFLVDNPRYIFVPLIALIAGAIMRGNAGTRNEDELVRTIDEHVPLHPREILAIGKANQISVDSFVSAVDKALDIVEEQLQQVSDKYGPLTSDNLVHFTRALRLRPSEFVFLLEEASGKPFERYDLIRRGCIWMKYLEDGKVTLPHCTSDIQEYLSLLPSEKGFIDRVKDAYRGSEETARLEAEKLVKTDQLLENNQPILSPENKSYRSFSDELDPPTPIAVLFSLFSSAISGVPEPKRDVEQEDKNTTARNEASQGKTPKIPLSEGADVPLFANTTRSSPDAAETLPIEACPSFRLMLFIAFLRVLEVRLAAHGLDAALQSFDTPQPALVSGGSVRAQDALNLRSYLQNSHDSSISLHELTRASELLAQTFQAPTRMRLDAVKNWPVKEFGVVPYQKRLLLAAKDMALKFHESDIRKADFGQDFRQFLAKDLPIVRLDGLKEQIRPEKDEHGLHYVGGIRRVREVDLNEEFSKFHSKEKNFSPRLVSRDEAARLLLFSRHTCVWGECFGRPTN